MECKVDGCCSKSRSKGMCNIHYQRHIRGLPLAGRSRKTVTERIDDKIEKQDSGCWIWKGAASGGPSDGRFRYGYINYKGKAVRVHRLLYELSKGIVLGTQILMHECDNPLCVNPDHLIPGTHKVNMHDMITKNRDRHAHGEDNHSKLSESDVLRILDMVNLGVSYSDIAKVFRISSTHARNIALGKKWKYIRFASHDQGKRTADAAGE